MSTTRILAVALLSLVQFPLVIGAQDPVPLYPQNYKVLLENDRVRVLDFILRKGDTEILHSHPANVVYVLSPFKIRFTLSDGQTRIRDAQAGEVLFSEAVTHSPENIGETEAHGILVELKSAMVETSGGTRRSASAAPGEPERDLTDAGHLTAVTFINGRPGREEELKQELLALEAPTRAEPGAITYDLYQSLDQKNRFMRFEMWRDANALETHKTTPHLKASFERRKNQGWTTEITLWKRILQ